ncbi:hypothetical protein CANTEDRAFT_116630 [Yamadazyma tenuis ATCC 10573]|nr:uncharacterized protein CANTEDRAFT_116630 [Yamadazyma tenuis ATCC 10573]EGV61191.1 hypothetical protein CANTEDRAFT_116630 [Yamadazyma tenuis ATCC 10573]
MLVVIALIYTISGSNDTVEGVTPINLDKTPDQFHLNNQDAIANVNLHSGYSEESILVDDKEFSTNEQGEVTSEMASVPESQLQVQVIPESQPMFGEITEQPFMPKMANETLKAQLGNAAWRLLHTILARYPEKPSKQEQTTLLQYIHLFGQVYPCGDCARHFQGLLKKYPPQVTNRKTAAIWGCHVHNKVNERLGKPEFDCTTILEDYDCGCGSDEQEIDVTLGGQSVNNLHEVHIEEEEEQFGG